MQRTAQLETISRRLSEIDSRLEKLEPTTESTADVQSLAKSLADLSVTARDYAQEHAVLSSLDYQRRPARHEAISIPHQKTFQWIFQDATDGSATNFAQWLEKENGVFWISGKPGSGKSTLMKFVADHHRTLELLSGWAWPKPAHPVKHFFWSAGTLVQRSHEGLYKSLLFDIFRQQPDLICAVCPERWKTPQLEVQAKSWSLQELRRCLEAIAGLQDIECRFCFFIDGLDEFGGDHADICETLLRLSESPHIKLCLSSRPWNVFLDSFGQTTRLVHVHELTRDDICHYVHSRLESHPSWKKLVNYEGAGVLLATEVTERAQGVFLWVFLVCRLLREGLTNSDSLADLMKRLGTIPEDLERFLKQILESVDPFYHPRMARVLATSMAAKEPLPTLIYAFQEDECDNADYALNAPLSPIGLSELDSMAEMVRRRLEARCKGLLEINGERVEFLHRTVRDFLGTAQMTDFIDEKIGCNKFTPSLSILRAYVLWCKRTPGSVIRQMILGAYAEPLRYAEPLDPTLEYASISEDEDLEATETLLEELETSLQVIFGEADPSFTPSRLASQINQINHTGVVFRSRVMQHKNSKFIARKLDQMPGYFSEVGIEPLKSLLQSGISWSPKWIQTIETIVGNNTQKDEILGKDQVYWRDFMFNLIGNRRYYDRPAFVSAMKLGIISLLLCQGADPNMGIYYGGPAIWVQFVLACLAITQEEDAPLFYRHVESFARDLDAMVRHGLSFMCLKREGASGLTYWDELKSSLEQAAETRHLPFQERQFLSRVLTTLIKAGSRADLKWRDLEPIIQKCCSSSSAQAIFSHLQNEQEPCRKRHKS